MLLADAKATHTPTVAEIRKYLVQADESFQDDPADNRFNHGFRAALETVFTDLFMTQDERRAYREASQ